MKLNKEEELLKFSAIIESKVNRLQYGTISVNVMLSNGVPVLSTMNITKQKRRRYSLNKQGDIDNQ